MANMADMDNMHYAIGPLFNFDCFGHLNISKILHMMIQRQRQRQRQRQGQRQTDRQTD